MLFLFLVISSLSNARAEPVALECCGSQTAKRSLKYYLRVRSHLLKNSKAWNAQLTGWVPYVRKPTDRDLSPNERAAIQDLYKIVWRLKVKNSRALAIEEFGALSRGVAYLLLQRPSDSGSVAEAVCGDQYWLQPIDEPLQPLVDDGCEPRWLMEQ